MQQERPILTSEQFKRELDYRIAAAIGKTMKKQGLITKAEYHQIEQKLKEKFSPVWGGLIKTPVDNSRDKRDIW